ncbi:helix-turn-helix transcriptional regulator [Parvibaculum sp.]|uniref:helix-turn-helix domain-containing protein n=1 Tax=Parvibaculum sp. TaxID=2024848 RepID=UPI002B98F7F0|nr:helix-turn-helix transcriptional regulator [Parvibaculum sp.]HUD51264.1 helix-turn-helix transcriptional regulator [Parvibaculum sp.]
MTRKVKSLRTLSAQLLKDKAVRAAYDEMSLEFEVARAIIGARERLNLTQGELATRMGVTQPFVARLESGRSLPTMATLKKIAEATGTVPKVKFVSERS